MNDAELKKISTELTEIKKLMISNKEKFHYRFLLGVVGGFGTVIGATIVVAVFIYVLGQLTSVETLRPFIEEIIEIVKSKG
jgi:hypothetical protein